MNTNQTTLLRFSLTLSFAAVLLLLTMMLFTTHESKALSALRSDKILGKRVSDFALEDQFERQQTAKFLGKQTILMIGDRQGVVTMRLWEEQLRKEFGDNLQFLRVAYFKGMPFFVPRGLARNEVKEKHPKSSVMLDWDGNAGEQFGYEEGCKISYIDPNSIIRASVVGDCTSERLKIFTGSIAPYTR